MGRLRGSVVVTGFAAALSMVLALLQVQPVCGQDNGPPLGEDAQKLQTCDRDKQSKGGLSFHIQSGQDRVSFRCATAEYTELEPAFSNQSQDVCLNSNCSSSNKLDLQCPGAILTDISAHQQDGGKAYQLTVPPHGRPETTLYYRCKAPAKPDKLDLLQKRTERRLKTARELGDVGEAGKPGQEGRLGAGTEDTRRGPEEEEAGGPGETHPSVSTETACLVTIKVDRTFPVEPSEKPNNPDAQENPPAPQRQPEKVTECSAETVKADLSTDKPLHFRCKKGQELRPASATKVYDDSDRKCTNEVELASLLKAALKMHKPTPAEGETAEYYELALQELPLHDTPLCYKCVTSGSGSADSAPATMRSAAAEKTQCLLKVSVKGTAGPVSSAFLAAASPTFGVGFVGMMLLYSV
ncbi:hypothetical protein BESB_033840 [Besnoitia besnoiti]|uniref:SRS domain-containing protein n=1 Tax=Besnoitia besnoiti TaxID=94643 RepID=A0A2A9MLL1_BESBE|nr:hypothetical protein BESB_033840 [Besnoitia besnoiti]PFH36926.1 hypothetical protein BESB_033840 [Besnoitia besnoiti]